MVCCTLAPRFHPSLQALPEFFKPKGGGCEGMSEIDGGAAGDAGWRRGAVAALAEPLIVTLPSHPSTRRELSAENEGKNVG